MRAALLSICALGLLRGAVITGSISDPDGGPVANAIVQAKHAGSAKVFTTRSSAKGAYSLSQLPAGTYDLTLPALGFTFGKLEKKGVALQTSQRLQLDLRLAWADTGNLGTPGDDPFTFNRSKFAPSGKPAPRAADGRPDFSGVYYARRADFEKAGLLPWAETIVKRRQANNGAEGPGNYCLPDNLLLTAPLTYKIVQTPKVLVMMWEGDPPNFRQVFLDQHDHAGAWFPTWLGHSIAKWEGDMLVVDTAAFNDRGWIQFSPHTEKLHLTERWRRPELARIEKEVTIEDPETFTKPWKVSSTWDLDLGEEVFEYICNENEADAKHLKK